MLGARVLALEIIVKITYLQQVTLLLFEEILEQQEVVVEEAWLVLI